MSKGLPKLSLWGRSRPSRAVAVTNRSTGVRRYASDRSIALMASSASRVNTSPLKTLVLDGASSSRSSAADLPRVTRGDGRSLPRAIAVASSIPFSPPADVPDTTSMVTWAPAAASTSPQMSWTGSSSRCSSPARGRGCPARWDARHSRSSSWVTPPIQTARLTPTVHDQGQADLVARVRCGLLCRHGASLARLRPRTGSASRMPPRFPPMAPPGVRRFSRAPACAARRGAAPAARRRALVAKWRVPAGDPRFVMTGRG